MKLRSRLLLILLLIGLLFCGCVNLFTYADLRSEGYVYPNDISKAKLLMQEMSVAHRNHLWDDIQTYNVQLEEESFGFFGKKSSPFKELDMIFSLNYIPKTFDGLMEIRSGKEKGQFWGVHEGRTYQRIGENVLVKENDAYQFSINTYQYFLELPNRITEATIVDYLGSQTIDGIATDGIIVSWNTLEPQKDIDQFVIWLHSKTKRIVKVEYTIREKFKFVRGEAFYRGYKEYDGFLLPTEIASKSNIKKNGYIHVKQIKEFTPNVLTINELRPL